MSRVGVCGLGRMGRAIAVRLTDAGHEVVGWNRSAVDPAAVPGICLLDTPAAVARSAPLVITMLTERAALRTVVAGPQGIAAGIAAHGLLIDMSTVGPAAVGDVAASLPSDVAMLDAPVIGSVPQVEAGALRILVGGERADFERAAPLLGALGTPTHVGPLGSGAALKLVANACTASLPVLLSDALALAARLGVPRAAALDTLEHTGLATFVQRVRGDVEAGVHPPTFRLALARKDLDLVLDAWQDAPLSDAPLSMVSAAADRLRTAERAGHGNEGFTAVIGDVG